MIFPADPFERHQVPACHSRPMPYLPVSRLRPQPNQQARTQVAGSRRHRLHTHLWCRFHSRQGCRDSPERLQQA